MQTALSLYIGFMAIWNLCPNLQYGLKDQNHRSQPHDWQQAKCFCWQQKYMYLFS